jgi:serpin B
MYRKMMIIAVLIGVLMPVATSCGRIPIAGQPAPVKAAMAMSDLPRETAPTVASEALAELAAGNGAFAFDLYQAIRGQEGNLFLSPYSISVALAMTYAGARGETERQMAGTLHYTLPQEQLHPAFNALDLQLIPPRAQDGPAFQLSIANSLWGQEGFPFLPTFLDTIALNYGAGMRLVDYIPDDKREEARQAINQWVSEETQGKIEELIEEDILNEYTRLVLANAIYFQAEWEQPFNPNSGQGEFRLPSGETITVTMMSRRAQTRVAKGEGYQAVELPYKGERISMLVLLPDEGAFEAIERSLSSEQLQAIVAGLQRTDLKLYLPRFSYDTTLELPETLQAMGMVDAFDRAEADFGGLYDRSKEPRNLYISHVVHKAFVAVDEKGTEAAAATGVVMEIESLSLEVRVDRPFIFVIHDSQTGTILFVGRVVDPRG